MKSLQITGYDGEAHIALNDVSEPTPGPEDVLVRVTAAAVNPLDMKLARGYLKGFFPLKFPYNLGTDLAGVIDDVGARVTSFRKGDAVLARLETLNGGAFAERAVIPARLVVRAPKEARDDEAAAFGTVVATAWQALFEVARISASTTLVVTGGAGSVGGVAVKLARSVGARVFAIVLGKDLEAAKELGAERVFESGAKLDLADIDVVFDTVGGDGQRELFGILRAGGMLASIASPPDEAAGSARSITSRFVFHESDGSRLALATNYCMACGIKPAIDRVIPLHSGHDAVALVASGKARGKVILRP